STIIGKMERISNRMLIFAAINMSNTSGKVVVANNTISGTMHIGINMTRLKGGDVSTPALIQGNTITHDTLGTDGYGITICNLQNFEIANNIIKPVNGRGILVDGYGSGITENGLIHDNVVEAREHANLEYPKTAMEAIALRM